MLAQERDFIIISLHISQDNAQEKIIGTQRESSYFGLDSFSSFCLTRSSANVNNNFIVLKQAKPLNISSLKANGQRRQFSVKFLPHLQWNTHYIFPHGVVENLLFLAAIKIRLHYSSVRQTWKVEMCHSPNHTLFNFSRTVMPSNWSFFGTLKYFDHKYLRNEG